MKIKFVKDYKAFMGIENPFNSRYDYEAGEIKDANDETAQWLIDNGFAEKVEDEWPCYGDKYWYVDADGVPMLNKWVSSTFDDCAAPIGNVFKTREPAKRFVDYLKAVETVRHDEGFMKPRRKIGLASYGYAICYNWWDKSPSNEREDSVNYAGKFYFDTIEHAEASIKEHESEWQTILDYDWSKE